MRRLINRRHFLKKAAKGIAVAGIGGSGLLIQGCTSKKEFEIVIKEGIIFDGKGGEPFQADIGITGDLIKSIGKIPASKGTEVIPARNLAVSPGFIDVHDHSDIGLIVNPKAESAVRQGITTLLSGNCGSSPFPVAEEVFEEEQKNLKEQYDIDLTWRDISDFFSRLEEKGAAVNYATLVGHGSIRGAAMGLNDRPPTVEELGRMREMVRENILAGAFGLSTGLEYAPGSYALADEIAELCKVTAQMGGVYATHMRDEGDYLLESIEETIEAARQSGVSFQISHFKIAYPRNWHKIDAALSKIEEAKKEGIDIACDRYPYIAGATGLSFYFPLWAKQGTTQEFLARLKDPSLDSRLRSHVAEQEKKLGSWEKVIISSVVSEKNRWTQGKSVLDASAENGKRPYDFMKDLLIEEEGRVGMITFMMTEDNLKRILAHPLVGVGCDGSAIAPYGPLGRGKPHPRNYGTFPRVLGKYVREEKICPAGEMIKKMTSLPAEKFGFKKRGVIAPDFFADLVIFDPDKIADQATWVEPHQYPVGVEYVLVNGQVVIERGEHTGHLPGEVLRKSS